VAKKERELVNPKWLLRQIMTSLPKVEYVRPTVCALWAFSGSFIEKADIMDGAVSFAGTLSYGQLADFCGIGYETAKWRMKQMRDQHKLVEWERFKLGIKFTFAVRLSGNGLTQLTDYLSKNSSQVTEQFESGNEAVQSGNGLGESGNRLPPLAFDLALSGESELATRSQTAERFAETQGDPVNPFRHHQRFLHSKCDVCGTAYKFRFTTPCSGGEQELNVIPPAPSRNGLLMEMED
jgi:hypothetical protein